jgi:antitoxin (DNA-binding transcriptional repressor) of toxin-antitoxin stability system
MEKPVNIHEAKTHLSRLVQSLRDGTASEIVIAVGGEPAARLIPYGRDLRRPLGMDRGLVHIADDFDSENARVADSFAGSDA